MESLLLMYRLGAAGRSSLAAETVALLNFGSTLPAIPLQESSPVGVYGFNPFLRSATKERDTRQSGFPRMIPWRGLWGGFQPRLEGGIRVIHCILGRYHSDVPGVCGLRPRYRENHGWLKTVIFLEAGINSTGAKAILWEGMTGRAMAGEWVMASLTASGYPSGSKQMGVVRRRSRPSWF